MNELDFIYKRHSVRKFTAAPVPEEHIREMIKAATYAPSGKNLQNWHFVVVTDPDKIAELARRVGEKCPKVAEYLNDPAKANAFKGSLHYYYFFKDAPVLVLVYAGPYETLADMLGEAGLMAKPEVARYARPNPGLQNIGAAVENLLLAAANLGYGGCWMTGPTFAADEISEYVGFNKEGYHLAAVVPLGVPFAKDWSHPPRKPLEEVLTIIR